MIEKEAYAQLRNEMTNIYSSFRQLLIVQYAGFAALANEEIKNRATMSSLSFGLLLAVMILLVTLAGSTWFIQAIRIGSYLMLNYELAPHAGKLPEDASARAHMWILANRSESRGSSQRAGLFNRYLVGAELRNFYAQQFVLALLATGISLAVGRGADFDWEGWHGMLYVGAGASLTITLALAAYGFFANHEIHRSTTESWRDYVNSRVERDQSYLADLKLLNWPAPFRSAGAPPATRTDVTSRIRKDIEQRQELIPLLTREMRDPAVVGDSARARAASEQYQQVVQEIAALQGHLPAAPPPAG